jgi:hypothetical protein
VDPDNFDTAMDPDPTFYFDTDPDPYFQRGYIPKAVLLHILTL